jgi:hypothetical protein
MGPGLRDVAVIKYVVSGVLTSMCSNTSIPGVPCLVTVKLGVASGVALGSGVLTSMCSNTSIPGVPCLVTVNLGVGCGVALVLLPCRQQFGMPVEYIDGMSRVTYPSCAGGVGTSLGGTEGICHYYFLVFGVTVDTIDMDVWFL